MSPVPGGAPSSLRPSPLYDLLAGLPDLVVVLAGLVTLLGDPAVLLAALAFGYWRAPPVATAPRRAFATLVGVAVAAAGLTLALKAAFALSRPPGAATAGFGFPSGHALGSAATYGGAVRLFDRVDRRRRVLVAGTLVGTVALSRVVLGVHYLVDVVAGTALGLALAFATDRPRRATVAAVACGLAALALAGPRTGEAAATAGAAVGVVLAPRGVGDATVPVRLLVPGLVVVAGATVALARATPPPSALALAGGTVTYVVLAAPAARESRWSAV